jgi:hypothetical protein
VIKVRKSENEADFDEGASRRILRLGLGVLWLVDAALQMQPAMFSPTLAEVWLPVAQGQPHWLAAMIIWSIGIASRHLTAFNWLIIVVQFAIGTLLLSGRTAFVRAGLWASVLFGVLVWLFGEGLAQMLAGGATILAGAPGSTSVYAVASVLLLLPAGSWPARGWRRASAPAMAAGLILVLCGALQLQSTFWTGLGLAAPFGQAFMMPQPVALRDAVNAASGIADAAPVLINALLVTALLGSGVLLCCGGAEGRPALIWVALTLVGAIWVFGQDAGMLFSGIATDPNSAAPLALLLLAGVRGCRARRGDVSHSHVRLIA